MMTCKARLKPRHRRLIVMGGTLAGLALISSLLAWQLRESLIYFHTPTQAVAAGWLNPQTSPRSARQQRLRLGGQVKAGSIEQARDSATVDFVVTDGQTELKVRYHGVLPDLFRAGQGVIAEGAFDDQGIFQAQQLLTKHSEYYTPPEMQSEKMK
jgi:cytochrome c-type biogenesis protein CcmE